MEKQLELKEASTRRKILALKQQLQGGTRPPSTAPAKPAMHITVPPLKESIPTSKSDHLVTFQSTVGSREDKVSHKTEPSSHLPTIGTYSSKAPTHLSCQSEMSLKESSLKAKDKTTHTLSQTGNQGSIGARSNTSYGSSNANNVTTTSITTSLAINSALQPQSNDSANQKGGDHSNTSASRTPRQKLTLPEEIKETEYMSAVQRQKARVSRIRRCIVAATVIQRAWRDYKQCSLA